MQVNIYIYIYNYMYTYIWVSNGFYIYYIYIYQYIWVLSDQTCGLFGTGAAPSAASETQGKQEQLRS